MPDLAYLGSTMSKVASRQFDYRDEHWHRGSRFRVVFTTLTPSSISGARNHPNPTPVPFMLDDSEREMCP